MKFHPMLEFYDQVMHSKTRTGLEDIELEIKHAVLGKILEDDRDIMMLNLAIQLRFTQFDLQDTKQGVPTVIVSGNPEDILSDILDNLFDGNDLPKLPSFPDEEPDVDFEQEQLNEFHDQELDQIKNGNVFNMKDFGKKI